MTSTIFSNKTFPTLYKWAFRRNRSLMIIYSILMALGIVIDLFALTQTAASDYMSDYLADSFGTIGFASIIIAQGGAMVFTFISALLTFSFLHNKRSVDMFGSVPTTRGTMFASHLLGGISAVAAPFTLGSAIVMGLTCRNFEYFVNDVTAIAGGLLGIAAAYVFTALICYCCGTVVDSAIITLAVNAIYAGAVGLFWVMTSEMIPGIDFESILTTPVITLFVPYGFCFFIDAFKGMSQSTALGTLIVWSILFIAGVSALTLFSAKRRRSETAQSEFDVKWLPIAIKAGASVVAGGLIGCIAAFESYSSFSNMIVYCFWYLVIGFAAFMILHLIFARGRKGSFRQSLIVYAAVTVVSLGLTFALTTGLGIDTYVPNASNIKSVEFNYVTYKDPENIETVTEIHKLITEGLHKKDYPYYFGYDGGYGNYVADYDDTYMNDEYGTVSDPDQLDTNLSDYEKFRIRYPAVDVTDFNFNYSKKLGFSTARSYYLDNSGITMYDYDKIEPLTRKLLNSEEYKRANNDILWDESLRREYPVNDATISYYALTNDIYGNADYQSMGDQALPKNEAFLDGLYEAMKKDILADDQYFNYIRGYYAKYSKDAVRSYLTVNISYKDNNAPEANSKSIWYGGYRLDVTIRDTYKNTLAYLDKNGIATSYEAGSSDFVMSASEYIAAADYTYQDQYQNFGYTGQYEDLGTIVRGIAPVMEQSALIMNAYNGDYFEWDDLHGVEFTNELVNRSKELYDKYRKDPAYIQDDYQSRYMIDNGIEASDAQYFYMEDKIIEELGEYSAEIVRNINETEKDKSKTEAAPKSSEKDTDTAKDMKTDSDKSADTDSAKTA